MNGLGGFYIEPPARQRQAAQELYQLYISYIQAGFTEAQAMQMLCAILTGVAKGNNDGS